MVYIGGQTGGKLWIDVYANGTVAIATAQAFYIELQGYSSDTAASATAPFSNANQGGIEGASGTAHSVAHMYLLHKTSADDAIAFSAGDLMAQIAIPEDMFRLLGYDYVQLRYETDANESSEKVDAFVYVKP
jgi:hypothetical protein